MILICLLSILSGVFYHLGGIGKPYPTKLRDWGCPACFIVCLYLTAGRFTLQVALCYLATFLLSWAALSTYYKKGIDCKWQNWFFHGLGCGLAALPLIWVGVSTLDILSRSLFLVASMTLVSEFSESVWYEEFMRGFIFTASMVFLI